MAPTPATQLHEVWGPDETFTEQFPVDLAPRGTGLTPKPGIDRLQERSTLCLPG